MQPTEPTNIHQFHFKMWCPFYMRSWQNSTNRSSNRVEIWTSIPQVACFPFTYIGLLVQALLWLFPLHCYKCIYWKATQHYLSKILPDKSIDSVSLYFYSMYDLFSGLLWLVGCCDQSWLQLREKCQEFANWGLWPWSFFFFFFPSLLSWYLHPLCIKQYSLGWHSLPCTHRWDWICCFSFMYNYCWTYPNCIRLAINIAPSI